MLELFTSQGCSSCPPADALLADYARRSDILALSFSVDYWDYMGWTDTLATHDNTERQRAYAAQRGDRQVYTPQVVVDGRQHVVGSDRAAIDAAVTQEYGGSGLPVDVELTVSDDAMNIKVGDGGRAMPKRATLFLVLYSRQQTVTIDRGENRGRMLDYHNVVRKI